MRRTFTYKGVRYSVQAQSEEAIARKIAEKKRSVDTANAETVGAWAEYCLSFKHLEGYSLSNYVYRQRKAIEPISDMKLTLVTRDDCQHCIDILKGKSNYTIKQTAYILKWLFDKAVEHGKINTSPALHISILRGHTTKRRCLSTSERKAFERAFLSLPERYLPFALCYYCGLRPEEARELRTDDIFKAKGGYLVRVRGTKTENATRTVPLHAKLIPYIDLKRKGYVALTASGQRHTKESFSRYFQTIKKDVSEDLVPYDLRHDYATRLCENNVNIAIAKELLGHSNVQLTLNIYQHVTDNLIEENLATLTTV